MNQRMCIACRGRFDKNNLIRIEKVGKNPVVSSKKTDGSRGIYICYDINCLKKAQKSKVIEKKFKTDVSKEFYNQIQEIIERK